MKKKIIIPILLLSSLALYFFWAQPRSHTTLPNREQVNAPVPNAPEKAFSAPIAKHQQLSCDELLKDEHGPYSMKNVKENPSRSERFHNRHLEYQGEIYRLRSFYDDANEGEQLTFLVYLEDEDEFAHITERSPLVKGQQYRKLEELLKNGEAQLIYDEIGLTIKNEPQGHEIFLRYQDGKLNTIQGRIAGRHLECLVQ